eukprot:853188-Rhodomonas_salina.2
MRGVGLLGRQQRGQGVTVPQHSVRHVARAENGSDAFNTKKSITLYDSVCAAAWKQSNRKRERKRAPTWMFPDGIAMLCADSADASV